MPPFSFDDDPIDEPAPVADPLPAPADPAPAGITDDPADPPALVRARWVSPQAVFNPDLGIIRYGDEIWVTPEQVDDPATPATSWADSWTPDPVLAALDTAPRTHEEA